MPLDFKATMLRAFNTMLDSYMFGDSLSYSGKAYSCIAPPIEQTKRMTNSSYEEQIPALFQIRKTDLDASGITTRATIAHDSKAFEVFAISTDNRTGIATLRTYLKQ